MGVASQAVRAMGTLLYIFDDAGANPVKVTEIVGMDENKTREILDVTHMDSPDDYREKLPSLKNAGQISVEAHYVPGDATLEQLDADLESGFKRKFKIVLSAAAGGEVRTFFAFVTSVSRPYKMDDLHRFNVTLDVTGAVVAS